MSQAHLLVDPDWPCMRIDAAELCANDWEAPIFISCWDWDLGDSDDEIGRVVVTMEDLQQAADEKAEIPLEPADDKERNVGFLIVNRLEIEMVPPERDIDKENQMPDPVEERMKMDRKTSWAQKFLDKLAGKDKQKASLLGVQTVLVWPTFVFFAVIMTSVAMLWLAEMLLWGTALDPSNRGGSSIIFEAELCGECHACSRVSSNMDDRLTPLIPAESLEALQIVLEDTCVQTSECETFCVRVRSRPARILTCAGRTEQGPILQYHLVDHRHHFVSQLVCGHYVCHRADRISHRTHSLSCDTRSRVVRGHEAQVRKRCQGTVRSRAQSNGRQGRVK